MLKVWITEGFLPFFFLVSQSPQLDISLLNLVALGTGAQSVIADRDTRRSDNLNKREGVRQ